MNKKNLLRIFEPRIQTRLKFILAAIMLCFGVALFNINRSSIVQAQTNPWMNTSLTPSQRASLLLAAMTQTEKLAMVIGSGSSGYVGNVPANTRLGIPALHLEDAGAGVADGMTQVTAFAAPITIAASWDTTLMQNNAAATAAEQKGKGVNIQLAPMMNIDRVPQAGRNFEGTGEDPYLSAQMAVASVTGIQSQGIIATAKHYIDNDQETNRMSINSVVDNRTQHEIYLPPFKAAVQAGVGAVMCSYNVVNGTYACENPTTQNSWLKSELAFTGFIMSDWGATHSTVASAVNGLDMDMPGNDNFFSATNLQNAINAGQVPQSRVDDMVQRILKSMFQVGLFDNAPTGSTGANVQSAAHTQLVRDGAAQSTVLLKNTNSVLPLNTATIHTIAVIGSAASTNPIATGGGSSQVNFPYTITPLQGITSRAGTGITVNYVAGATSSVVPSTYLKTPGGATGLQGQYYTNTTLTGTPVLTRTDANVDFNWTSGSPGAGVAATNWSVRWTGTLTPPSTGTYSLMLTSDDGSRMYVNGALVVNNWSDHGDQTVSSSIQLTGGQAYTIEIDYYQAGGGDDVHFAWITPSGFSAATTAASGADVAIVVTGVTSSEGSDRSTLALNDDALISAVVAANPRTIVVVYSPAQVLMPWSNQVAAILVGGLPGQEEGNSLASVLFGDVNPSGKLPYTIAQNASDYPANTAQQWPGVNGNANYSEGLLVGYRWFDSQNITPLFPFGHGLSYTTFSYANLSVSPATTTSTGNVTVAFDLTNSGTRAGAEVPQLYLGFPAAAGEPPKSLKGFQKITLQPNQTQHITFTLTPDLFSYWNNTWQVATGVYPVMVGSSSRDIRLTGSFQVGTTGSTLTPTSTTSTVTPTFVPPTNTNTPTPVVTSTGCGTTNIALNKTATSSSNENAGTTPNLAVDGNTGTRWSSAFSDPQWIQIDLGSTQSICHAKLTWETAYGKAYQIQVSNDAATWTTIYSTTTGTGGVNDLTGLSGSGRYIRMYGTVRGTQYGYSIWEFEVYAGATSPTNTSTFVPPTNTNTPTPIAGCGTTNIALNKPTTSSANENASLTPNLAVDGNTGTRWSSAFSDPQWIQVDLGSTMSICHVKLTWETAYGKAYQIQVSNDAATWTTIYSTTTGAGGVNDLTGLSGSGRYIRMYGTVRGTAWGYSLWEFEVYGG